MAFLPTKHIPVTRQQAHKNLCLFMPYLDVVELLNNKNNLTKKQRRTIILKAYNKARFTLQTLKAFKVGLKYLLDVVDDEEQEENDDE